MALHSFLRRSMGALLTYLVLLGTCLRTDAEGLTKELSAEVRAVDFEGEIVPLLDRRCAGCHVGERAKGGFRITDRDAVLGYVEPGDVESSSLWTDYLNAGSAHEDPSTLVMPLNGPIAEGEREKIRQWIEEGADWPENFRFVSVAGIDSVEREPSEGESFLTRLSAFFGYFHAAVVHFPIALLIFGGGAAALSFFTGGRAVYVAYYCLIWGTLAAIVATYMGWGLAAEKGYPAWNSIPTEESIEASAAIFRHRWLGTFATLLAIVVSVVASIAARRPKSILRHLWRWGLIAIALIISLVGHQGGEMVYGDILHKALQRLSGE